MAASKPPGPPDAAAQSGDKAAGADTGKAGSTLSRLGGDILQVLVPLLLSAGGIAAFVFGVGGAVSAARFYAAGLPQSQAVNAAARSDMQAIGLTWLVVFGSLGLLAMVIAYVASPQGRATPTMYYAVIGIAAAEAGVVWALGKHAASWSEFATGEGKARDLTAAGVLGVSVLMACCVVAWRHRQRRREEEGDEQADAEQKDKDARGGTRDGGRPIASEADKLEQGPLVLEVKDYALLTVLSIVTAVSVGFLLEHAWVTFSLLVAGALGLLTIRVAALRGKEKSDFAWYGVCVFFSVAMFGAVLGVLRMLDEPRLQPVAFLQTDGDQVRAMQGIYVGESDDRFWYASIALENCARTKVRRGSGRLQWLPQSQVSQVAIGPAVGLPKLAHEAQAMQDDVIADNPGTEVGRTDAVRDTVAVEAFGRVRQATGKWVHLGSREDLGDHPNLTLHGERLRLRHPVKDGRVDKASWEVRLDRRAVTGAIYANCGERTNSAWLTIPKRPYAVATASYRGRHRWELDASGSSDPGGQIDKYRWKLGGQRFTGRTIVVEKREHDPPAATLVVEVDGAVSAGGAVSSVADARKVLLRGAVSRTFPSDLLFPCLGCHRLTPDGRRRIRSLRADMIGARSVTIRAHTDEHGSGPHNKALSRIQAKAVAKALAANSRLKRRVRGMGESHLAQRGDRRENRRIEVIIYRKAR